MDTKQPVRRALIKGALAAPAVLTVRSASATARGSAMVCLARDAHRAGVPPRPAEMVPIQADNWMRRPVTIYRLSDLTTKKAIHGKYFPGTDGVFWKLDDSNPHFITATRMSSYTQYSVSANPTGEVKYALEYFDSLGKPTKGFGWERRGGNALTRSCHTSFRGIKA